MQVSSIQKLNLKGCLDLVWNEKHPLKSECLQEVDLSDSSFKEVPVLRFCPKLEILSLRECQHLEWTDESPTLELKKLREIDLGDLNKTLIFETCKELLRADTTR